jgi:hypothetical protein
MCDRSRLVDQALDAHDNYGGFMLVDPYSNVVVDGGRYDLSAEYVIDYCQPDDGGAA